MIKGNQLKVFIVIAITLIIVAFIIDASLPKYTYEPANEGADDTFEVIEMEEVLEKEDIYETYERCDLVEVNKSEGVGAK